MKNSQFAAPHLGPLQDFKNFLYLVWKHLGLPDPTPVQYDIADWLQYGPKRSITMAFRGVGKSYITVAFCIWLWLINPQWKILVVSASEKKALEFATLVKQLIDQMPLLSHLKPGKNQRDSVLSFDVGPATPAKDPSLNVAGITGQITGGRADFIVPDDIETPDNCQTVTQREKLSEKVKEFDAILKPDPWCQIKYLGTPQTENSLYVALSNKGYVIRVWPARYPKDVQKYVGRLSPMILNALNLDKTCTDKPTDQKRFTDQELRERELSLGPTGFQMQYMLDPSLSDEERYPLKLKDFIVMAVNPEIAPVTLAWNSDPRSMVVDPTFPVVGLNGDRYYKPAFVADQWIPYEWKLMAIDPSGRGSDETAYVVLYGLKGFVYIAEWGGMGGGYSDTTLLALAMVAQKHKVNRVVLEDNFGDGMYTKLFQPILGKVHPTTIEEVSSTGQKEKRICDTIEPVLAGHRIVIDEAVIRGDFRDKNQELQALWQLTRITRDKGALKKDDRIDVLAIGLAACKDNLGYDTSATLAAHEMDLKEQTLDRWLQAVNRASGPVDNWIEDARDSRSDHDEVGPKWWDRV